MSVDTSGARPADIGPDTGRAAPADQPPATDPAQRGRTTVADRVVEKIAARAATDVERATGSSRQVLGFSVGSPAPTTPARVDVTVDGDVASVRVALSVRWPSPVRDVCRQVRDEVTERVTSLTGVRVAEVDVDVTALPTRTTAEPPRVV